MDCVLLGRKFSSKDEITQLCSFEFTAKGDKV